MKTLLIILSLALPGAAAFAQQGYEQLPNAGERAALDSEYLAIPSLHLEIVQEGTGVPDQGLASAIKNEDLQKQIQQRYFLSLQLRDLYILKSGVKLDVTTQVIHVPFLVSVKHTQNSSLPLWLNPDQGTIEVAGEFEVTASKDSLSVAVSKFYDSNRVERFGRKISFNSDINLEFARAVAKPELEAYFNSNPGKIKAMVSPLLPESAMPPAKAIMRVPAQP